MVFNGAVLFALLAVIWLVALTVMLWKMSSHYGRLTKGTSARSLKDVLETLLDAQAGLSRREAELATQLRQLEADGQLHLQNIGVLRYNPFADTGGSQSFSMAILDADHSGIVVTSLFARSGNRWFVKEVEKGKGKGIALSKEEETAIRRAMKRTD